MSSKVIKFVAGGGKTTYCLEYLRNNRQGIYLAFNNSVVNSVQEHGFLARTIDSFFQSFLIPKFVSQIPIIAKGAEIEYLDTAALPGYLKGVGQYKIHLDGGIYCKSVFTGLTLDYENDRLQTNNIKHVGALRYIFGKDVFRVTNDIRAGFSSYLINVFGQQIIAFIKRRFAYVIIDESQDLNGYKEEFARLLFNSDLSLIVLGDDQQNINGGGEWFESLTPDEERKNSFRCPEKNCEWIRNNLSIEIYGNENHSDFNVISFDDAKKFDNGETVLLYAGRSGDKLKTLVDCWNGPKETIKKSKGETINADIVIAGESLSKKVFYTAITRTTKNVYSTIKRVNDR